MQVWSLLMHHLRLFHCRNHLLLHYFLRLVALFALREFHFIRPRAMCTSPLAFFLQRLSPDRHTSAFEPLTGLLALIRLLVERRVVLLGGFKRGHLHFQFFLAIISQLVIFLD